MSLDLILAILFWLGLLGLLGLLWHKWPILKVTNPSVVLDIEQKKVKHKIVQTRLLRNVSGILKLVQQKIPKTKMTGPRISRNKYWLELENKIKAKIEHKLSPQVATADLKMKADKAFSVGDYEASERYLLSAVEREPHNFDLYNDLGNLYLEKRDFEPAREVYEYLVEQGQAGASLGLARVYFGQGRLAEARKNYEVSLMENNLLEVRLELARILDQLGEAEGALLQMTEARKIEPNNPKILDFFIELSIVNGRLVEAESALNDLRGVNPDNQKISDFAQAIRALKHQQKIRPK